MDTQLSLAVIMSDPGIDTEDRDGEKGDILPQNCYFGDSYIPSRKAADPGVKVFYHNHFLEPAPTSKTINDWPINGQGMHCKGEVWGQSYDLRDR